MSRFLPTALLVLGTLTGCNREPLPDPAGRAPVIVASVPSADGTTAAAPSVPQDIVGTTPRRQPVAPRISRENRADDGVERPETEAVAEGDAAPRDDEFDEASEPFRDASGPFEQDPPQPLGVHWDGVGDAEFGMGVDAVRDAWPGDLGEPSAFEDDECLYLSQNPRRPADAPALMFEGGRLVRYDVDTPRTSAPGGGRVGMDTQEILDRYGEENVYRSAHKYSDGEYLRVENPEGRSVLLFETSGRGLVTGWRMGIEPQVDYVEGCS